MRDTDGVDLKNEIGNEQAQSNAHSTWRSLMRRVDLVRWIDRQTDRSMDERTRERGMRMNGCTSVGQLFFFQLVVCLGRASGLSLSLSLGKSCATERHIGQQRHETYCVCPLVL